MKSKILRWKTIALCSIMFCLPKTSLAGQEPLDFIHRLGMEARPRHVSPTNPSLQGENERWRPIQTSFTIHLKYPLKLRPSICADRIYGGVYQGISVPLTTFSDKKQLGDPFSFYVFQGARTARFSPRAPLNYEWNFDLFAERKPYDNYYSSCNGAVGSRINAYINAGVYINWTFSRYFDLIVGGDFAHFSNGNAKFPNVGINTAGAKIGFVYSFNRMGENLSKSLYQPVTTRFPRHISCDIVLLEPWHREGVWVGEKQIASPNAYPIAGFNFAPMYNLDYKSHMEASLDGVYNSNADVYREDVTVEYESSSSERKFLKPGIQYQLALGLSGHAEYVIPYFTIGIGMGANVLSHDDIRGFCQILALKIAVTRSSFLHIGYNLQNSRAPNYLMLGLSFHFHNKYPKVRH